MNMHKERETYLRERANELEAVNAALLEALELATMNLEMLAHDMPKWEWLAGHCRAAIAKAKGKE